MQPDDVLLERPAPCVAGRKAKDLRRLDSLVTNARARQLLEAIEAHALEREDRTLRLGTPTAVVADLSIRADHAVTRDEVRDGVVGQRCANRTHGRWVADLPSDPAVWTDLAPRNLAGLTQNGLLERGLAAQIKAHPAPALEFVLDLFGQVRRCGRSDPRPAKPLPKPGVDLDLRTRGRSRR